MKLERSITESLGTAKSMMILFVQFRLFESEIFSHFRSFDLERICIAEAYWRRMNRAKKRRRTSGFIVEFRKILVCELCDLVISVNYIG